MARSLAPHLIIIIYFFFVRAYSRSRTIELTKQTDCAECLQEGRPGKLNDTVSSINSHRVTHHQYHTSAKHPVHSIAASAPQRSTVQDNSLQGAVFL